jgi:6-phosphogluconolactonase (cycloisomerase 2 family)
MAQLRSIQVSSPRKGSLVKALTRLVPAAAAAIAIAAIAAPAASAATAPAHASPAHGFHVGPSNAVFVMTDNTAGNSVAAYHRASDGTLTLAGTYSTGGLGGILSGSVVDHTASEGSLTYDKASGLLFAVNPGSDTVSVFRVFGDQLKLSQVIWSGGDFPVSVTVHGDQAYVLNALGGGTLAGYRISGGWVSPIHGSSRALGLGSTAATPFTNTPGQVTFSPDGRSLLVTTKAATNAVDVFAVYSNGTLSAAPKVNTLAGDVPFAVAFDWSGHVVVAEAGPNAVATFGLAPGGVLKQLAISDTGQTATCWIVRDGAHFYASNAGSGTESGFDVGSHGALTALGTAATDAGTVDATAAGHGRFLYVQTGKAGIVDEFAVGGGGTLTSIGSVTVAGSAGGEGIAAG